MRSISISISVIFSFVHFMHRTARTATASLAAASGMSAAPILPTHLVVLSHGLGGCQNDLAFLGEQLEARGCVILKSRVNAYAKSLAGVELGGAALAQEVSDYIASSPASPLSHISFVGNSLGGLYCRYAISRLFEETGKIYEGLHIAQSSAFSFIMHFGAHCSEVQRRAEQRSAAKYIKAHCIAAFCIA
jgi:hypothetical protein